MACLVGPHLIMIDLINYQYIQPKKAVRYGLFSIYYNNLMPFNTLINIYIHRNYMGCRLVVLLVLTNK